MARLSFRHRRHQIERADRISRSLLVFAIARGVGWLLMIVAVLLGVAGVPWLHWAATLGGLVVFITLISLYANAEGEFSQAAGYWAALRAGRAHAQGVEAEHTTTAAHAEMLGQIHELAETIHEHQLRQEK